MCLSVAFIAAGPVCLLVMLPGLRTAQVLRTQGSSRTRDNFSRMCTHPITPVVAPATLAFTRAPGLQKLPNEKTPGNLLRNRFLQAVFPNAYFVVLKRHPLAVSMATQKWKLTVQSLDRLFKHWLYCHELFEQDKQYLHHLYELRYEDYVNEPERFHHTIAEFIGTGVPKPVKEDSFRAVVAWRKPAGRPVPEKNMEPTSEVHNQKYFDR